MTLKEINNKITFYTSLDDSIYTKEDRVIAINNAKDKLHSIILESQDEWKFDDKGHDTLPIGTNDLVAGVSSYALPPTIYKINRLEINYGQGYIRAYPLSLGETNLTNISENTNQSSPRYSIVNNTITIYPTPLSNGEICIYYDREVKRIDTNDLEDGTAGSGFDALFDNYIAIQASLDAGLKFDLANEQKLKNELAEMEVAIRKYYGSKNQDRKLKLSNYIESYD